jgi:predicted Fe-Mo cluster-binding NifX family protein
MLIAVTTSNGIDVDTHFGKADRFLVYDVTSGEPQLMCEVQAPSYCSGAAPGHSLMPDKLAAIADALGDCRVVVTAMIGDAPREELDRLGIIVHTLNAPVADVLREVVKLY